MSRFSRITARLAPTNWVPRSPGRHAGDSARGTLPKIADGGVACGRLSWWEPSPGPVLGSAVAARVPGVGDARVLALLDDLLNPLDRVVGHPPDLPVGELHYPHRRGCDHVGVAGPALEQTHLPDEVPLLQGRDLVAVLDHVG